MTVKRSTRRTVEAFRRGVERRTSGDMWTDGTVIVSRGLIIAAKSGRKVVVNPPAPAFPAATRQRIAEIMFLLPKAVTATSPLADLLPKSTRTEEAAW